MSRRNQAESDTPKLDRERRKREVDDVLGLLSTKSGRRFMWRVFSITGIFRNSFTGSSETFFNEGKRVIGTTLLADLMESAPGAFALMQTEAAQQEESDAIAAEIERDESDG